MYPIKSCRGTLLEKAVLDERGIRYDRRWMLVDRKQKFLTQRKVPRMALIVPQILRQSLRVSAPGMEDLLVPLEPESKRRVSVQIWSDRCDAVEVSAKANEWFSDFLHMDVGFVFMPEDSIRPIHPDYAVGKHSTSFSDGFPLLLISEASLEDLNSRLKEPVPMNRFRPNLVVSGCEPFAEDRWKRFRIGSLHFAVVKPCSRCIITTTDQASAQRGKEPLQTLASYRTFDRKILFGQNVIHEDIGEIRVGQDLQILEK